VDYPDENLLPGDSIIDQDFTMQKDLARVSGYVTNTDGEFISNVSVSAGLKSSTTNEQGYYEIDSLQVGEISITFFSLKFSLEVLSVFGSTSNLFNCS